MAETTDSDDHTGPQSKWGRAFWRTYEELAVTVKSLPSASSKTLIPEPQAPRVVKQAEQNLQHAALLLDSKGDDIDERWDEPVVSVSSKYVGDNGVTTQSFDLSLKTVATWTPKPALVESSQPGRGRTTSTKNVEGHLPPIATKRLFAQLTRGLEDLGWLPEAKETPTQTEITDEMIEKVEEWRIDNLDK